MEKVIRGNVIQVTDQVIFSEPWIREEHWQPRPPYCFRIQGVDLKTGCYRVWATNGVLATSYLISQRVCGEFLKRQRDVIGASVLDDSGIGLDEVLH